MTMAFVRRLLLQGYQTVTGRRILDRLEELNRTQWWSRDDLLALQRRKLYRLTDYASRYVPYYRQLFDRVGFQPTEVLDNGPEALRKIPLLTKETIRANFSDLLTTESRRRARMSPLTTGGSTGHPLVFMQDTDFRDYVTADLHRHLGWAGWQFGELHAYIWGTDFEVALARSLRARLMNWVLNRFITNAYVLSDESMAAFAEKVRRRRPRLLFGYASSLYRFAQFIREHGPALSFDGIFSSAEVLFPAQRLFIEETFGCRIFDRYGTRDLGGVACECEAHTGLHASIENNYIEILRDLESGDPASPGETGHIIVTNLNNYGMPFIRYSIEDMGAWSARDHCPCGRQLPLISVVEGRRVDLFQTRDGRTVWGGFASPLFGMPGVKQFQVVQKSPDLIVVRIVRVGELNPHRLAIIERTIHTALGEDVTVRFEFPTEIPVLPSGKYRYAFSEWSGPA